MSTVSEDSANKGFCLVSFIQAFMNCAKKFNTTLTVRCCNISL